MLLLGVGCAMINGPGTGCSILTRVVLQANILSQLSLYCSSDFAQCVNTHWSYGGWNFSCRSDTRWYIFTWLSDILPWISHDPADNAPPIAQDSNRYMLESIIPGTSLNTTRQKACIAQQRNTSLISWIREKHASENEFISVFYRCDQLYKGLNRHL